MSEEQQILTLVDQVRTDQTLREQLLTDPQSVLRSGFSSTVTEVIMRLVPHLTVANEPPKEHYWWR